MNRLLGNIATSIGLIGAIFVGCLTPIRGASIRQQHESVESSLLLSGSLIVNPDGSLRSYQINDASKLPPVILALINKSAASWHFEPVKQNGHAVAAKAAMSMRIVAKQEPGNHYELSIHGAQFGNNSNTDITSYHTVTPHYPYAMARSRFQAETYIALRINHEGKVVDAAAAQVNVDAVGPPNLMTRVRKAFAKASIEACRLWTFKFAKGSAPPFDGYWIVLAPINYKLGAPEKYSGPTWETYVPGPQQFIPWLPQRALAAFNVDAMANHGIYDLQTGLTLTTKLSHG